MKLRRWHHSPSGDPDDVAHGASAPPAQLSFSEISVNLLTGNRSEAEDAFARRVDDFILTKSGCWLWEGAKSKKGYGRLRVGGKDVRIHRLTYALFRDWTIPSGLTLDHVCRVRNCANPWHLQPVSNQENVLRGTGVTAQNARKTHCHRGHEFTPENTRVRYYADGQSRVCLTCDKIYVKNTRQRRTASVSA